MSPPGVLTVLLLIVLYALAWHDKSGHEPYDTHHDKPEK